MIAWLLSCSLHCCTFPLPRFTVLNPKPKNLFLFFFLGNTERNSPGTSITVITLFPNNTWLMNFDWNDLVFCLQDIRQEVIDPDQMLYEVSRESYAVNLIFPWSINFSVNFLSIFGCNWLSSVWNNLGHKTLRRERWSDKCGKSDSKFE